MMSKPSLDYYQNIFVIRTVGIPNIHWSGQDGDFRILIMDLLGHSLEDLFTMCQKKFSIKTVLMLAEQIISRMEFIHAKNYIYRDIKPDNFLIGTHKKADHIYLIDFGLAKQFRNPNTSLHIPWKDGKSFIGTVRYSSINSHLGIEQSRRDDMEAVGYMLLYFLRGSLPWQGVKSDNKKEKYDKISQIKMNTTSEELCKGFPGKLVLIRTHLKLYFHLLQRNFPNTSHTQEVQNLTRSQTIISLRDSFVISFIDWNTPMIISLTGQE